MIVKLNTTVSGKMSKSNNVISSQKLQNKSENLYQHDSFNMLYVFIHKPRFDSKFEVIDFKSFLSLF